MARRKHIPSIEHPYHVTNRGPNRRHFTTSLDETWKIMSDQLYDTTMRYNVKVHAFVLMPNHYHLLISTPEANLSRALNYFTSSTSREINRISGTINQNFGARNYQCLVNSYHYYMNAYKYLYRNPVEAKLCQQVEDYQFSTLHGITGRGHLFIPLLEDTQLFPIDTQQETLTWMNRAPTAENLKTLRFAFRRREFRLPKIGANRQPHPLETQLY